MYKWIVLSLLFFMNGVVMAIDYKVVTITDCVSPITTRVTGTLPIDIGEYLFLGCTNNNVSWECPCNNPIIFSVQKNAINNYTIRLDYTTSKTVSSSSGGSGGSGGYNYKYIINATPLNITNTTNTTVSPSPPSPPVEVIDEVPIQNPIPSNINQPPPIESPPIEVAYTDTQNIFQKIWSLIKKILFYKLW